MTVKYQSVLWSTRHPRAAASHPFREAACPLYEPSSSSTVVRFQQAYGIKLSEYFNYVDDNCFLTPSPSIGVVCSSSVFVGASLIYFVWTGPSCWCRLECGYTNSSQHYPQPLNLGKFGHTWHRLPLLARLSGLPDLIQNASHWYLLLSTGVHQMCGSSTLATGSRYCHHECLFIVYACGQHLPPQWFNSCSHAVVITLPRQRGLYCFHLDTK